MKRGQFGEERYEKEDFQRKVVQTFGELKEENWAFIDANNSVEDLGGKILELASNTIKAAESTPINTLWT